MPYKLGEEFILAADNLKEQRNIDRDAFIGAICDAILAAFRKKHPTDDPTRISIDYDTEEMSIAIYAPLTVVEVVENSVCEISITEAREFLPDVQLGEEVEADATPKDFTEYGRIAVSVARQIIQQRLNEEEKKLLFQKFEEYKGTLMVGQILRVEEDNRGGQYIIVDLGRFEGVMPPRDQIPHHYYRKGDKIRVYISDFKERDRRMAIIVSQSHPNMVEELFKLEIPEIEDGIIEIMGIARIAGGRSKVAVKSNNNEVDPIGACIGARGSRIQNIIADIYNEKIDVIPYSEDPVEFISYALSPTQILEIGLYDNNRALIIVPDDQLSLAIGKNGQNVKLATKLTGWKLDIRSESAIASANQQQNQQEQESNNDEQQPEQYQNNEEQI